MDRVVGQATGGGPMAKELIGIMKSFLFTTLCCATLAVPAGFADDEPHSKRFYAGKVLAAEINSASAPTAPELVNIPEHAPPVEGDGYAMVVVKLDPGRSLGIYDYVLADDDGEYPCVAISASSGNQLDASVWEIKDTKPAIKYRLLFKVASPDHKKYTLKFKLRPGLDLDPDLTFVNLKGKLFTKLSDIPAKGILGVDPNAPKPKPNPKGKPQPKTKEQPAKTAAKKPAPSAKKSAAKKVKDAKHAADQAAW